MNGNELSFCTKETLEEKVNTKEWSLASEFLDEASGDVLDLFRFVGRCAIIQCILKLEFLLTIVDAVNIDIIVDVVRNQYVVAKKFRILSSLFERLDHESVGSDPVILPVPVIASFMASSFRGTLVDIEKSLKLLLDRNGDPNAHLGSSFEVKQDVHNYVLDYYDTPLSIAIKHRWKPKMKMNTITTLLEYKADPNAFRNQNGETLLHLSYKYPSVDTIVQLTAAGAIPSISHQARSPLHTALYYPSKLYVEKALKLIPICMKYINQKDEEGNTPLLCFLSNRTSWDKSLTPVSVTRLLSALVEAGGNVSATNSLGENAAHLACCIEGKDSILRSVLQFLIRHDPSIIHQRTKSEDGILHMFNLPLAAVDFLTQKGLDINEQNGKGQTALHIAVSRNRLLMVSTLLEKNIDHTLKDKNGNTSLEHQEKKCSFQNNESTSKRALQIRSKLTRGKRKRFEVDGPISKHSKHSFHSVIIQESGEGNSISIKNLPLELIFEILGMLDPYSLMICEGVCRGWYEILRSVDGERFWKSFCDNFFWSPKGGWQKFLRPMKNGKQKSMKEFYWKMEASTCRGCRQPTSAFLDLFEELVCLHCRYSLDHYYYYTQTDISFLKIKETKLRGIKRMIRTGIYAGTFFAARDIEPIVFQQYGKQEGAKRLLVVESRRPTSRNFNFRITRLFTPQLDTAE